MNYAARFHVSQRTPNPDPIFRAVAGRCIHDAAVVFLEDHLREIAPDRRFLGARIFRVGVRYRLENMRIDRRAPARSHREAESVNDFIYVYDSSGGWPSHLPTGRWFWAHVSDCELPPEKKVDDAVNSNQSIDETAAADEAELL